MSAKKWKPDVPERGKRFIRKRHASHHGKTRPVTRALKQAAADVRKALAEEPEALQ